MTTTNVFAHTYRFMVLAALCVSGCASHTAFDTTFPVGRKDQLQNVLARLRGVKRPDQSALVVGVTDSPRGLFAYDLTRQSLLFSTRAEVEGVPLIAGNFAVVPETETLRLRALSSGRVAHELPRDGMHLVGADGDGSVTAVVLSSGGSYGAKSLLVMLRNDSVTKRIWVDHNLGAPAVLGGLVFVPHGRVHLSVLTPEGDELARLAVRDDVASEALTDGEHVFFGMAGLYLLDAQTREGVQGGAHYFAPALGNRRKLPGAPNFLRDTAEAPAAVESAVHRIALSFWPESSGSDVGIANHALYLSFYRLLFSLSEGADSAHWVRSTPSDMVGVRGHRNGVVVVEARGVVSAFDAEGRALFERDMGVKPLVASIRADGLAQRAEGAPPPPVVDQLVAAALHEDTRLVPAGELSVRLMGGIEDAQATETLITICARPEAPRRLRDCACEALGARKQGGDAILVALAKHNDYLAETSAAPLAPLAQAAVSAGERRAAPLLLDHLEDPSTSADDLPSLIAALQKLADGSAAPRVAQFVRLYHADAGEPGLSQALSAGVRLLAQLDPENAPAVLEPIAADPRSEPALRDAAAGQLATLRAARETMAKAEPNRAAEGAAVAEPPSRLTPVHLTQALGPVREQITQCVRNDPGHPIDARLTVVVEGDGAVASVQTLPASLRGCVEPLVRKVKLPASTLGKRETLHHTISH